MMTPADDAARTGQAQGTTPLRADTRHSPFPAPASAGGLIAQLGQRVQVWVDSDRVLPADGSLLLATLERVQAGLAGEDASAVQAGIERFVGQVQALVAAGGLEESDGRLSTEAAAAMLAWLSGVDGSDG